MSHDTFKICVLKVLLVGIEPPIWRRILVPYDSPLSLLHVVIQIAMGWESSHLYEFEIDGVRYLDLEMLDDIISEDETKTAETTLEELAVSVGNNFSYTYDFGDNWEHSIQVEEVRDTLPYEPEFGCRGGARACPPEDCGGIFGYQEIIDAKNDPNHPRREELLEWMELEDFDEEQFDVNAVNEQLQIELLMSDEEVSEITEDFEATLGKSKKKQDEESERKKFVIMFAMIAERQMMSDNPPETRQTLERLVAEGYEEEDAFTMVLSVIAAETYNTVQSNVPSDNKKLVAALDRLPLSIDL